MSSGMHVIHLRSIWGHYLAEQSLVQRKWEKPLQLYFLAGLSLNNTTYERVLNTISFGVEQGGYGTLYTCRRTPFFLNRDLRPRQREAEAASASRWRGLRYHFEKRGVLRQV